MHYKIIYGGNIMGNQKITDKGYIKLIAIDVDHFKSKIIDEKNVNYINNYDDFINKYSHKDGIYCFYLCIQYKDGDIKII